MFAESNHPYNRAAVYAVRGKLSMARAFRKGIVLGDPGLLASRIYNVAECHPKFALGIIPRYADFDCPTVKQIAAKDSRNVLVIDIRQKPLEVIRQITKCAAIVSSSLHGLIFADAFNIPSVWMRLSDKVSGTGFKFYDYYSVFEERPAVLDISQLDSTSGIVRNAKCRSRDALDQVKGALEVLYHRLNQITDEVRWRRKSRLSQLAIIMRNRCSIMVSENYAAFGKDNRPGMPPALRWLP